MERREKGEEGGSKRQRQTINPGSSLERSIPDFLVGGEEREEGVGYPKRT